jgi:hypothetical protein
LPSQCGFFDIIRSELADLRVSHLTNVQSHTYIALGRIFDSILWEISMTDTNALPPSTCGDDYPPSRPGIKTLIIAVVVIIIGAGILFWPVISAAIH